MLFVRPGSWRGAFLVGLLPSLLVLWIRTSLREPSRPVDRGDAPGSSAGETLAGSMERPGGLTELLGRPPWRGGALLGLGLAAVGMATYWGIFAWGPELAARALGSGATDERRQTSASLAYLLMNFSGGLAGLLSFAPIANRLGRRGAFALYHVGAGLV